jgi:cation diffusion facilitator family transporter
MIDSEERLRTRRIAAVAWISVAGNALLAALKIVTGATTASFAVLGDGLDSLSDVVSSLLTVIAARILTQPPDSDHPYGHQRADTITSRILSFIIFFTGAQLAWSTLSRFLAREPTTVPGAIALIVTGVSIFGKLGLYVYLRFKATRLESEMLRANARNMRGDIVISCAVFMGVFFTRFAEIGVIDLITGFVVGLWIMRTGVGIFMETNMEIMDGMSDSALYFKVFDAVETVSGASNPHRARIRRQGPWHIIELDIEVDPEITVAAGHEICQAVEARIREVIPRVYDIMVHVEPHGNEETQERFGLDRDSL